MVKDKKKVQIEQRIPKTPQEKTLMKKRILTLFLLLMPILIIGITYEPITKILAFFYEAVLLKNFIDDHYLG